MHQRNIVVAGNDIAQSREPLFYPLQSDCIWQRISQVLQFLVSCPCWYEEAVTIACAEAANDTGARYRGVDDGDNIAEFALECGLRYEMSEAHGGVAVRSPRT